MNQQVLIDDTDYQYPTKEERRKVLENYPRISGFGFSYQKNIMEQLDGTEDWDRVSRNENLFWWDISLQNKLGKLQNAFVNSAVNYYRGLSGEMVKVETSGLANFQFKFYTETFYYFFFSTRDIILQIVNLHCNALLAESAVSNKTLLPKLDGKMQEVIKRFNLDVKEASDVRNKLTHKFPVNERDGRSRVIETENGKTYHTGRNDFIPSSVIISNMEYSLNRLMLYVNELKGVMKINN